ncbi:MAG: B12-binding domain-containing radical SAM protein [Deltaproteobacteria bacterium]|nr:B12-binding domain-containing radical SAM protein [Deltaproteobacteria bacterium]
MKVLFIQNNGIQESIGISSLSGTLKANGHQTDLLLVSHTRNLIHAIREIDPGLIAFSALTGVHQSIEKLAHFIKQKLDIPIIVGGPHATFSPQLIEKPGIDVICRGEGEYPLLELVEKMARAQDITKIRNLYVKGADKTIYKNDLRPLVPLDELAPPDREIYYKYAFLRNVPMKRFISSIGCPYPCTFCHEPVIRKMYLDSTKSDYLRRKSVKRVIDEIRYIKTRHPLKHVHFSDDLFFIRNSFQWLEEFADRYPAEIDLPFTCNLRYDSVVEHSANLLSKAGCYGVAVGLESGNEKIREIVIRKRSKNEHITEGARLLRERGIKVLTTNMIGLPGETLENAFETLRLNMALKSDYVRATTFLLFPGLPLVDYARKEGFLDPHFDIDKHIAESVEINLLTPYAREFRNIASLFWLFTLFSPKWIPLFKKIVRLPDNIVFRAIGAMNMLQELLFYRINIISGFVFFKNTVLMARKSGMLMTLRSVPQLIKKKKATLSSDQQIWEADRGYF